MIALFARDRRARTDALIDLSRTYRGTALVLGDVIEADDTYTGTHSRNVLELSLAVADALRLDGATRREVEFTSLLHDIGKLRIPNAIIQKPGPLTPAERALINTHTIEGERILGQIGGFLGHVGAIVRSCHERWDGERLPGRPRRRADPDRRPHRLVLRRLRRHHERPALPARPLDRGRARGARGRRRVAVRPRRRAGGAWRSSPAARDAGARIAA